MLRPTALLLLTLLPLTMTACEGNDAATPAAASPASPAALTSASSPAATRLDPRSEAVLRATFYTYTDGLFGGNAAASYKLLTKSCRATVTLSEYATVSQAVGSTYGAVDFKINSITIEGDRASLESTTGVPVFDDSKPGQDPYSFTFEDGSWHVDRCEN